MFRDFLMLLRRYTASSILNIIGMALAFASAYLILVQVNFDMSYNRKIPNAENIYRLEWPSTTKEGYWLAIWNRYEPNELCEGIPEIVAVTTMNVLMQTQPYTLSRNNSIYNLNIRTGTSERQGLDLFEFIPVAGSFDQFTGPNTAIVSASYAKQHGLSVGDVLRAVDGMPYINITANKPITIVAIYQDIPAPSDLSECNMIIGMPPKEQTARGNRSCHAFIRLHAGASPEVVTAKMISQLRERYAKSGMSPEEIEIELKKSEPRLNNLKDLYFHSGNVEYAARSGNQSTTYTLLGVAILIIIIACINFFNFFLALVPSRIRAVNTRKVFGGSNLRLRMGFFAETIGLVILALLIGAVLVMLFANTSLASYLTTAVFSPNNLEIALLLIISALILGIVICIYPAHYITSFPPALATKGTFQSTRSGILLRYILIGTQFVISTVLVIVALFINLQHSYMMNYDMGFDQDEILAVQMKPLESYAATDAFAAKLKQSPMILDVAFAASDIVSNERMQWGRGHKDKEINFDCYAVSWNFLKFMGIDIVEGRDFTKDDEKRTGVFIFNEEAKRQYELEFDELFSGHQGTAPHCRFL